MTGKEYHDELKQIHEWYKSRPDSEQHIDDLQSKLLWLFLYYTEGTNKDWWK